MTPNLQCVFNYLSFLEKETLFFYDISTRFENFYRFVGDFHDGFYKDISKMKGQNSLGVVHQYPSLMGKQGH